MARKKDVLDRLAERLARGEISESTYLSIKERYEKNGFPEEDEELRAHAISISIPDFREMFPAVHKGDFEGDEYCCTGVGKVPGHLKARHTKVVGVCKIGETLDTDLLETHGALKVGKGINTEELRNSGALSVGGSVNAKKVDSSGSLKIHGDVETESFTNSGACRITSSLTSKGDVVQSGLLRVGKDVTAKNYQSTGAFRVGGTIRAEKIDIEITSDSRAGALEAPEIEVKGTAVRGKLRCETVKGKKIHLEVTDADLVEGDDVYIGPRCRIGKVIAKNLKAHETAKIETKEVGSSEEEA
jgi:cytoskeletal protein CcmA (bactofilin family)